MKAVIETHFPDLKLLARGKVRDTYEIDQDTLLIVATDRISAYDVVMPTPISGKGWILTQMTLYWLNMFREILPNHLITDDVSEYPAQCRKYADVLEGRSMLVKRVKIFPVEAIVRNCITGSGWKSYQKAGTVCGISLPPGLLEAQQLPELLFTPSTKAEQGSHDENISFEKMVELIGERDANLIREYSIGLVEKAVGHAASRGIIIADTKFEFGLLGDKIVLADEVLTPDSSRFWPADKYKVGTNPPSFDKQYLRDYLVSIGWKPSMPAPELPKEVVENTRERYFQALIQLTALDLPSSVKGPGMMA